jgi:hypothetical protein
VSDLNKFETLRYPDMRGGILERGMTGLYGFRRGEGEIRLSGSPPPSYELHLTEIDQLFGAIWLATNINPEFFTSKLSDDARTCLIRENKALPFGTGAND